MKMKLLPILMLFIIMATNISAQVHFVPSDYETIQMAIDEAAANDTIILQNGTFVENITINKPLTIASLFIQSNNSDDIENTVIDGNQTGSTITISDIASGDVYFQGIRVINGSGTLFLHPDFPDDEFYYFYHGGGFFIQNVNHVHFNDMRIEENTITTASNDLLPNSGGGGMLAQNSQITIDHSNISDNIVEGESFLGEGAGLWLYSCNTSITNSIIDHNQSDGYGVGQGIYSNNGILHLENNTISNNGGARASAIQANNTELFVFDCDFYNSDSHLKGTINLNDTANSINNAVFESCHFYDNYNYHGGIIKAQNATLMVNNCEFNNNVMGYEGGAIHANYSTFSITNSEITNNTTSTGALSEGAGLFCNQSIGIIDHVDFISNSCDINNDGSKGGAMSLRASNIEIRNSKLLNNIAYNGGAIATYGSTIKIKNTLIAENESVLGAAVYSTLGQIEFISSTIVNNISSQGVIRVYEADLVFVNTILWNENGYEFFTRWDAEESIVTFDHSNIRGFDEYFANPDILQQNWLANNINQEPLFVNEEESNYELSDESPMIDAGTAFFEYNGQIILDLQENEYAGNAPDIGAFEKDYSVSTNDMVELNLEVYPNPIINAIYIRTDKELVKIQLFDMNGQLLKEESSIKFLDVQDLKNGAYILICSDINNNNYYNKLIKF